VVNRFRLEQEGKPGPKCRVLFVVPDYFEERPKACMNGWGSVFLSVAPDGMAMPCHNARNLPGLQLPNVKDTSVAEIWERSNAFNAYRGDAWMKPPCRDCDERHKDFGGCRCQAFMITGDAANADPVCSKSPDHDQVVQMVRQAPAQRRIPIVFRSDAESRLLHPAD
jgi:PqqA peptide cyclase